MTRTDRGLALIEYAVLAGAIILALTVAAQLVYRSFLGYAEAVEQGGIMF